VKSPKVLLIDDRAGKPEDINLIIGRRPYAAVGNSIGDQQKLGQKNPFSNSASYVLMTSRFP
jgi:hypothetical protein